MAKRDPNKTARNKTIHLIKEQRRILQQAVYAELEENGFEEYCNEMSLNAFIGSKIDDYIDVRNDVFKAPMDFISAWTKGLFKCVQESIKTNSNPRHQRIYNLLINDNPNFKAYVTYFLQGSFLKHYEALYKNRPQIDECEFWFGNNDDEFGFLVTPRWRNNSWENDKSEIRHFKYPYWTISHVLETGFCYLREHNKRYFSCIDDLLGFFRDMCRRTKSTYQLQIADKYIGFVNSHPEPESIPFMIPELRYDPLKRRHEFRLDFTIINPWNMNKTGFEFSPWSTHGQLLGKDKSTKELNLEAKSNFEKEMEKHKKYWRKYEINYIIYTDKDLSDVDAIWEEIKSYLKPNAKIDQLELQLMHDLLALNGLIS